MSGLWSQHVPRLPPQLSSRQLPRQDTPKAGWARQGKRPQSFTATTQDDALTPEDELPAHPERKPTGSNTCSPAAKLLSECVHNQKDRLSFGLRTDTLVNKAIRIRSSIIISWQPRINKQLRKIKARKMHTLCKQNNQP